MGTVCKQRSSELLHLLSSFSSPPTSAIPPASAAPQLQYTPQIQQPPNFSSPSVPCPSPRWCQRRWRLVTSLTDPSDNSGLCLRKPSQQMATTPSISLPSIYTQDLQAQICAPGFARLPASPWRCGVETGLGELGVRKGLSAEAALHLCLGRQGASPPWQLGELLHSQCATS